MAKKGYKNIDPDNQGVNSRFSTENQPKKRGRKPSIRKELEKLLEADGRLGLEIGTIESIGSLPFSKLKEMIVDYLQLKPEEIKAYFERNPLIIKVNKAEAMAIRFNALTMSKSEKTALDAIERMIDQIDGKPNQRVEFPSHLKIDYTD